jgi:hypothetical protein
VNYTEGGTCKCLTFHVVIFYRAAPMADLATTVARWRDSAAAGQARYAEGVQATQVDVVGRAIAAQPKLLTNVTQAITSGRWARRLQERGTAGWKAATVAKAPNYSTGIAAGVDDYQRAMQEWLPIIQSAAASVQSMPNTSFNDSLARMTAFATALHNAKLAR